jgi:cytochrome c biogenesis factor
MHPDENDPANSTVTLNVKIGDEATVSQPTKDVLIIEASIKPFVGFVWLGTLVVLGGLILSIARRSREARGQ